MYDAVRTIVLKGPHLPARLVTSFRSRPRLVEWLNERFDACLGAAKPGKPVFNPHTGEVRNEALQPSREDDGAAAVRVVSFDWRRGEPGRLTATWRPSRPRATCAGWWTKTGRASSTR
jgi:ATP-dependent helicase/nuclease subunit A